MHIMLVCASCYALTIAFKLTSHSEIWQRILLDGYLFYNITKQNTIRYFGADYIYIYTLSSASRIRVLVHQDAISQ
jgi:hypothetical protein